MRVLSHGISVRPARWHAGVPALAGLITLLALGSSCSISAIPTPAKPETTRDNEVVAPAPDTRLWRLFSSQKHGFEFRYPESCQINESDDSLYAGGRIELAVIDSEGLGLADYVARVVDSRARNGGWTVESIKSGFLSGQEAATVEYRFGGQGRYGTATFTGRREKVYIWGFTAGGFTCDEPDVYGPILSSFRFTE